MMAKQLINNYDRKNIITDTEVTYFHLRSRLQCCFQTVSNVGLGLAHTGVDFLHAVGYSAFFVFISFLSLHMNK